jgi:hypothetical protein
MALLICFVIIGITWRQSHKETRVRVDRAGGKALRVGKIIDRSHDAAQGNRGMGGLFRAAV